MCCHSMHFLLVQLQTSILEDVSKVDMIKVMSIGQVTPYKKSFDFMNKTVKIKENYGRL